MTTTSQSSVFEQMEAKADGSKCNISSLHNYVTQVANLQNQNIYSPKCYHLIITF